jgi:aryl-alcohol dehydrogenase-like predicted oxidoreductase
MPASSELPTRTLGRTGLQVTRLGYGAMELRDAAPGRQIPDSQAQALLEAVLEGGINFIDTSIDYGRSQERIGRFIAGRRSEYVLASKCGCTSDRAYQPHVYTRENVVAGVERDLRELRTDYLDLIQIHNSPSRSTLEQEGSVDALIELQRQGKVRFIGISGMLPNLPDHIDMGVFDVFQIPYSPVQPEHRNLITRAAEAGRGTIIRGGAARGAVSPEKKDVTPIGLPEGQAQTVWTAAGLDDLMHGEPATEFLLRLTLSHPDLHTTIVGTINLDHLQANLATARKPPLPVDVVEEATRRLTAAEPSAA